MSLIATLARRDPIVSASAVFVPCRATPTGSSTIEGCLAAPFSISAMRGSSTSPSTSVFFPAIAWMTLDGRLKIIFAIMLMGEAQPAAATRSTIEINRLEFLQHARLADQRGRAIRDHRAYLRADRFPPRLGAWIARIH